jgi:hypothetical protein
MEPDLLILPTQQYPNSTHPELDESNPHPSYIFHKNHFNIILPFTRMSFE